MPTKLIIQIPCFNEEESLPISLTDLPRQVPGIDTVEWLVVDDGSTDNTVKVAREWGVDHIVSHPANKGLAHAFSTGINACLAAGADVIVNTDADNQYKASYIADLVQPVLEGRADMVIGTRPISSIEHFSAVKKVLQKAGSWVTRLASHTQVADAPSGFRAFSRKAAQQVVLFTDYSYTLETIIQAGQKNMTVVSVPVEINDDLRPSRLVKSIPSYIKKSASTIIRIFVVYRPFRFFATVALALVSLGLILGLRFLYYYLVGDGDGHIQSVILSAILLITGFQTFLVAFLADLLAANRKLLEEIRMVQKTFSSDKK